MACSMCESPCKKPLKPYFFSDFPFQVLVVRFEVPTSLRASRCPHLVRTWSRMFGMRVVGDGRNDEPLAQNARSTIGHGRWVPGGVVMNMVPSGSFKGLNSNVSSTVSSSRHSRGFGQAECPGSVSDHPGDHRQDTESKRAERAERASMW